jgi:hypothetical protein
MGTSQRHSRYAGRKVARRTPAPKGSLEDRTRQEKAAALSEHPTPMRNGWRVTRTMPSGGRHAANIVVADREIALPLGIAGVGFGQALGNGEAVGIGFQRGFEIALRDLHAADIVVADREIALPARIAYPGAPELGDPPPQNVRR